MSYGLKEWMINLHSSPEYDVNTSDELTFLSSSDHLVIIMTFDSRSRMFTCENFVLYSFNAAYVKYAGT